MLSRTALVIMMAVTTAGVLVAHAPDADAQRYQRRYYARPYYRPHARVVAIYPQGLYVGGGLVINRILHQEGDSDLLSNGAGLTLYTGLRINRALAVEAGWIGTLHRQPSASNAFGDGVVLNGFTGDAKLFFESSSESFEPYVQAGVGLYLLDSGYFGAQSAGAGFQAGGGFRYKLGEHADLGLRALYRGLAMGPPNATYSDTYVSGLTVEANLGFQF